jgi:hypothetical protein
MGNVLSQWAARLRFVSAGEFVPVCVVHLEIVFPPSEALIQMLSCLST